MHVTFHPCKNVTVVQLPQGNSLEHYSISISGQTMGEALIASFCHREQPTYASTHSDMFMKVETWASAPSTELLDYIKTAIKGTTQDASLNRQKRLRQILLKHHTAFVDGKNQIGLCTHTEHSIELGDSTPVTSCPLRCTPSDRQFFKEQVRDLLGKSVIRGSGSEYASPTIVVDQPHPPTTPRRMVHDYRKLNSKTINTPYPMSVSKMYLAM